MSRGPSYLLSYWVSGFSAAFAVLHLIEGGFVWTGLFLALAVVNYFIGRRDHKRHVGRVMRFESLADLRVYLDEQESA